MAVVAMQKVVVVGHTQAQAEILSYLQKQALLEITAPTPALQPERGQELALIELESSIELLDSVCGRKKNFIETFAPPKEEVENEALARTAKEFDWHSIVAKLNENEARLANSRNLEQSLLADLRLLWPWRTLAIGLNELACTQKICLTAGSCKPKELALLQKNLDRLFPCHQLEIVNAGKDKVYLLVLYLAAEAGAVADLIAKSGLDKVALPISARTAAGEIAHLEQQLKEARQEQAEILKEIRLLAKYRADLTYVYDFLFQALLEKAAREKALYTDRTFIFTGWVPRSQVQQLRAGIQKLTPLADVFETRPEANEIPPTLIANPKVLYPFEMITRIFGLPSQGEIDPTAPLAFFYLLFFAMCLSDVGYGIILSLLAFYYLKTLTLSTGGKKLLLLLFWGGIMTIFVGILTGSYFGIDINLLPPVLKRLQVIDPIKNPLNVLVLSLLLGVGQNLFGIFLSMFWKMRKGDILNAVLDDGLWIYFLTSLVLLVGALGLGSPLSGLFSRLAIAGAILLVLTQGRNEQTLIKKGLFGLLSLYKTTGYLGDTLSYSRLLALMMTTSIIGMVINIIALLTKDSVPILGYVFMAAILIVGHTFNLIVSVLGAFIHSARLQLVEFFGKFYSNGGKEFRPFRHETKYVIIK
ncbi:MAG: V-type ATPase 116kDa subunit family protein [Candidatus Margulisbacteria bacterium]|nr:V-type ATPase 116kDa subunit family protein [Candidatus Margulisiibacteriota bacterium]